MRILIWKKDDRGWRANGLRREYLITANDRHFVLLAKKYLTVHGSDGSASSRRQFDTIEAAKEAAEEYE